MITYTPKVLMTLIASVNILMSSRHRRWLTPKEIISIQGFPIVASPTSSGDHACSSFAMRTCYEQSGLKPPVEWPSRRSACHQAGNSMHVSISGIVILFALTQVQIEEHMMRLHLFMRQRDTVFPTGPHHTARSPKAPSKRKHQSP